MSASKESLDAGRELYVHSSATFDTIISGLKEFSNLHNVRINFRSPEEELLLIEKLENLEYLNDTKIIKQKVGANNNNSKGSSRPQSRSRTLNSTKKLNN